MRFCGIDPATTTGFVALDENGEVLVAQSIKGIGKTVKGGITDEQRVSLENQLYNLLIPEDEIVMEGPGFGTQMAFTTGMIHGSLRSMICRRGLIPNKVAPDSVKKYVGVSNFVGEKGSKQRLKGNDKKEAMKEAVLKLFNWTHPSHDVIDAYIIARIAWNVYLTREYLPIVDGSRNQIEVVKSILAGTEE